VGFSIKLPTLSQVTGDVGKAVERVVKDVGRSDVGKAYEALTTPTRNLVRAAENLGRGDIEGAAGNIMHANYAKNPVNIAANASSTIRDVARNRTVNQLTLGLSNDYAEVVDHGRSASYGREIDATDWSSAARLTARGVAIAGGVALLSGGTPAKAATEAATATGTGAVAGSALGDAVLPGAAAAVRGLLPSTQGAGARSPASEAQAQNQTINPIFIVAGVGIFGLIAILATKR